MHVLLLTTLRFLPMSVELFSCVPALLILTGMTVLLTRAILQLALLLQKMACLLLGHMLKLSSKFRSLLELIDGHAS